MREKNPKSKIKNPKLGFTLIELLVVISIIGILSTLLMANVAGVRERARDAQRKSDINQIQKALEMYKNSQTTPSYPPDLNSLSVSGSFISSVPHDPKCGWNGSTCTTSWPDYSYARNATDTLKYTLKACLENASDPQSDLQKGLSNTCSTGYSFTRTEP